MNEFEATAVMVALFALRCVTPIVLTLTIGYLMNKLIERWESETEEELIRPPASPPVVTIPCWLRRNCSPEAQAACAARQQPGLACWLVRLRNEGVLPKDCPDCPVYAEGLLQLS
ncbi:MAG: hypothetical protein R3300_16770 [Candidatus Promineifilaceae bacterium]|nr:hypothetical protein [Candidatus Promineifilaceae bacterium]